MEMMLISLRQTGTAEVTAIFSIVMITVLDQGLLSTVYSKIQQCAIGKIDWRITIDLQLILDKILHQRKLDNGVVWDLTNKYVQFGSVSPAYLPSSSARPT
jgi:hypothetical protein